MLIAKQTGGADFEPVSEGVHQAVCTRIYDLGTQFNEHFGTQAHKVMITWEITDEIIEIEGECAPRNISKEYTLSLHKKASLRSALEAWRSKKFTDRELDGFDLKRLIGANCQLQIIHVNKNGKTFANIAAIMALPKGSEKAEPDNGTYVYSQEDGVNIPEGTPEWIRKKIMDAEEWDTNRGTAQTADKEIDDEEIPF